jgi:hypothetical protein
MENGCAGMHGHFLFYEKSFAALEYAEKIVYTFRQRRIEQ